MKQPVTFKKYYVEQNLIKINLFTNEQMTNTELEWFSHVPHFIWTNK